MTVSYNPNPFQTLPAKKHYFETSLEFVAPGRQLENLKAEPASEEWERRRHNLHAETQTEENRALQSPRKPAVQAPLNSRGRNLIYWWSPRALWPLLTFDA